MSTQKILLDTKNSIFSCCYVSIVILDITVPDRPFVHLDLNLGSKYRPSWLKAASSLTLVCEKHLGERRHPHQEVQHGAAVGVVGAVVVGLHGGHGVVLTYAFPVLLL